MPSTLLGLARGTLKGFAGRDKDARDRAEEARQREREQLRDLLAMSELEGVTFGDPGGPALPPPVAPTPPAIPPAPGAPPIGAGVPRIPPPPSPALEPDSKYYGGPPPAAGADREYTQEDVAQDAIEGVPSEDDIRPRRSSPISPATAPTETQAAARAPRNVLEIGKATIGGQRQSVNLDVDATAGARKRTATKENRAAYDRANADGTLGGYDPTVDYRGEERKRLNVAEVEKELIAAGIPEKEAHLFAEHHIDLDARRRANAAAGLPAQRLKETERHNRAMEGGYGAGGPLSKDARVALGTVEKQIGATRSALSIARRAIPKKPLVFINESDSTDFEESRSEAVERASALENRGDSLRVVGDSLAAIVQKKPAAATKPGVDTEGMKKEFARAGTMLKQLLATPGIDPEEANEAYAKTVEQISRKYGAIK